MFRLLISDHRNEITSVGSVNMEMEVETFRPILLF